MNKDTSKSLIKNSQYRHAENLRFHVNNGGDGTGVNVKGTVLKSDVTEGNTDLKCIGAYFNTDKDVIYYKLASTDGQISIDAEYNIGTDTTTIVLKDTTGVLKYDKTGFITGWDEIDGLQIWSEWGNNIRRINTERAKTYGVDGFTEDDITLIVKPPLQKLKLTLQDTTTPALEENNIEEKFIYFSYRYRYLDGEYSVLAPFTKAAFLPNKFKYNYAEQSNESMINKFNQVLIEFNTGNERVTEIQLIFKESESNSEWIIDDFNKELLGYGHNESRTFEFNNNKTDRALSDVVLREYFSNVPLTAKAQSIIDGRLLVGHYKENYDIKDNSGNKIELDYSLLLVAIDNTETIDVGGVPTVVPTLNPLETCKSNRDYEVVMVYLDEFGRATTSLQSKTNTLYIKNENNITGNSIDVILKHKPPFWAKHYRFFIKQTKKNYDQLLPVVFYEDGAYRWIKLEGADKDKVKEGDYLIVKSDTQGVLNTLVKTRVLEVKQQEKNFLQPDDVTDKIVERSGLYFKIKPKFYRIELEDLDTFYLKTYDNSSNSYDNPVRNLTQYISQPHFYGDTLNDLVSSGSYNKGLNERTRYLVKIDNIQLAAKGTVTLNTGASGSVDSVTVNGVEILSGSVPFNTDLPTTATDVATNITANTSSPNYTAIAIGNIITITSLTLGTSPNGFVILSTATTITTTDVNMSGGSENTFKWSDDDGATFIAENVPITGTSQSLNNGVSITFGSTTGHSLLDEWNINARDTFFIDADRRAYGFFRTENNHDEILENREDEEINIGARIFLEYDEYKEGDDFFTIDETSSTKYDNIEEWFWKEDIISKIIPQGNITLANIFFVRGTLFYDDDATQITQDDINGTMTLLIKSHSVQNSDADGRPTIRAKSEVIQSNNGNIILLETEPTEQPYETFYEIGKTYDITDNYHISDPDIPTDVNQSAVTDLRVKLDWFNAYSYGNAVESYKIKDEFNKKGLDVGIRVSAASKEEYKQITRIADISWSDVYNDDSNFNGLSSFNLSLINFISLDKENSTIQKLYNSNSNLMVFQEDAIGIMPYNKNIIYDTQGGRVVGISQNILSKESYRAYAEGLHGISKNPESFVAVGTRKYFTDRVRGNILRLANNGITEINENLLEHYTSDEMKENKGLSMIASFDPKHKEYLLHLPNEGKLLCFKEKAKGFPEFYTLEPDFMLNADNEIYAWKNGKMYILNASETRNNFFGVQYQSKLKFYVNQEFGVEKVFNAIGLQSTHAWLANLFTNLTSRQIPKSSFSKIEDYWYSEIMGNTNLETVSSSKFGLGTYAITNGEIATTFKNSVMSIGDYITSSTLAFSPNKIVDIQPDKIILETNITEAASFLMYSKNQNVDGESIRGDFMEVELINDDTEKVEIKAVTTEVTKSYYS